MLYFLLPKEQVEKYVEIDKRMKPEDLVYRKHNFNRYQTIISFISTEVNLVLQKLLILIDV